MQSGGGLNLPQAIEKLMMLEKQTRQVLFPNRKQTLTADANMPT